MDIVEMREKAVSTLDEKIRSADTELDPQRVLSSLAGIGDILAPANAPEWQAEMPALYHKCRVGQHTHVQAG